MDLFISFLVAGIILLMILPIGMGVSSIVNNLMVLGNK